MSERDREIERARERERERERERAREREREREREKFSTTPCRVRRSGGRDRGASPVTSQSWKVVFDNQVFSF